MLINGIAAAPELREFVRFYRIIDFKFPPGMDVPAKAYPPRPEHCLQFVPRHESRILFPGKEDALNFRNATFSGVQTITHLREIPSELLSLQVVFQPFTIYTWYGIPANELSNLIVPADMVFPHDVNEVNNKLADARSYDEMIGITNAFLIKEMLRTRKSLHAIDHTFDRMLNLNFPSLDGLADDACLSYRQFDRKFVSRAGVTPKEFIRITRFDKAFRMKNRNPELDWLSVAVACGFYDYQHLAKDYKYFTNHSPADFFKSDKAPERLLGQAET